MIALRWFQDDAEDGKDESSLAKLFSLSVERETRDDATVMYTPEPVYCP